MTKCILITIIIVLLCYIIHLKINKALNEERYTYSKVMTLANKWETAIEEAR